MAPAIKRIVFLTTSYDEQIISAKAELLGISLSELLLRGAMSYKPENFEAELAALAEAAHGAADRMSSVIDDSLRFISESNMRIAALEAEAAGRNS